MKTNIKKYIAGVSYVLVLLTVMVNKSKAQSSILQRPVYLEIKNMRADKALELISKQCNFNFTYNTSLFSADSTISIYSQGANVKQVLDKIFKNSFEYKVKGNNLIIARPVPKPAQPTPKKKTATNYVIQGAITNQITGENIAFASVYDTASLASAVTNVQGFFKLVIESKTNESKLAIAVSKKDFIDTVIVIEPEIDSRLAVSLLPQPVIVEKIIQTETIRDTHYIEVLKPLVEDKKELSDEKWLRFLASLNQRTSAVNIAENRDHYTQFSIVPALGTDGAASTLYTYHLSLNLLGGYTGGINGLEAGSIFNLNKGKVRGTQLAGLFNATGGNVTGLQAAGFINKVYGSTKGVQSAGFMNINSDSLKGIQLSGFMNINGGAFQGLQAAGIINIEGKSLNGAQYAGFMNINDDSLNGIQAAGFLNIQGGKLSGVQLAGFCNLATHNSDVQAAGFVNVVDTSEVQLAGFINISRKVNTQIAGFINLADTANGFQAAGFINLAKAFNGVHIGVINIADTCKGLPIGVLSIIKKGLHQIEVSTNEVTYVNLAFRGGIKKLYTVITVGASPIKDQYKFMYGFGIGHSFVFNQKSNINVELFANQLHLGNWDQYNSIYGLKLAYEHYLTHKISLFAGASVNLNLYDSKDESKKPFAQVAFGGRKLFQENYNDGYQMNGWIGFNAGIRFL